MYTFWKFKAAIIGMLLIAIALVGCAPGYASSTAAGSASNTPDPNAPNPNRPSTGTIGSTLILPNGSLAITLLSIEQHGSQFYFHFRIHNQTGNSFAVISTGTDYQFIVPRLGRTAAYMQTAPVPQVDRSTHPALSPSLAAQTSADGWVAIDTTLLGGKPQQIAYRYATVHTKECSNPSDQSTCHPADLYRALLWNFQL
jgi:hypothetical protein